VAQRKEKRSRGESVGWGGHPRRVLEGKPDGLPKDSHTSRSGRRLEDQPFSGAKKGEAKSIKEEEGGSCKTKGAKGLAVTPDCDLPDWDFEEGKVTFLCSRRETLEE